MKWFVLYFYIWLTGYAPFELTRMVLKYISKGHADNFGITHNTVTELILMWLGYLITVGAVFWLIKKWRPVIKND